MTCRIAGRHPSGSYASRRTAVPTATPGHRVADGVAFVAVLAAEAVFMCCVYAAAMRITISSVGPTLTIGFSPRHPRATPTTASIAMSALRRSRPTTH